MSAAAATRASVIPPIGTRFERIETRKGKIVGRRVYELTASKPTKRDMAGEHTMVCVVAEGSLQGIAGTSMVVEDAWFTERTDFKRVTL